MKYLTILPSKSIQQKKEKEKKVGMELSYDKAYLDQYC